jgi:predicted RNA-binding Zn-ribbon protein involved in translation (DUF1610 family)
MTTSPTDGPDPVATVHESYAFTCLSCGHGWEHTYAIEHHIDHRGREYVEYRIGGERVPSPLAGATCPNCGHETIRILRSGTVAAVMAVLPHHEPHEFHERHGHWRFRHRHDADPQ